MEVSTYVFKNVSPSNNLRVTKREVISFSSQYILHDIIQNGASLFEEMPNRSNSGIWKSFLSFLSKTLKVVQECPSFL